MKTYLVAASLGAASCSTVVHVHPGLSRKFPACSDTSDCASGSKCCAFEDDLSRGTYKGCLTSRYTGGQKFGYYETDGADIYQWDCTDYRAQR